MLPSNQHHRVKYQIKLSDLGIRMKLTNSEIRALGFFKLSIEKGTYY